MKNAIEDNWIDGILLEDPVVEDVSPEPESEFNPVLALAAAFGPPLVTVLASMVIGEYAFFVWVASVLVGGCYIVRRLPPCPAIFATVVYWVMMLFEFIAVAMSVPGVLVLHGE